MYEAALYTADDRGGVASPARRPTRHCPAVTPREHVGKEGDELKHQCDALRDTALLEQLEWRANATLDARGELPQ
jgi:hypothetical protein